jgi:Ala-tRNA(Pro) deacylase
MIPKPIRDHLSQRGIPYDVATHPPRLTAQETAESCRISGRRFAKVVVAMHGDTLVLAALPAAERVDLAALAAEFGEPVRLAREDEFAARFPQCEVGAMPPLGELYDIEVVADACLALEPRIAFAAGTHTDVVEMRWSDFEALVHPRVVNYGAEFH